MYASQLTSKDSYVFRDAARLVQSWGIPHLERELQSCIGLDRPIAILRLTEAVSELVAAGVPLEKLLRKLRDDLDVWPTWAELRAAHALLRVSGAQFILEPNRSEGKHPDYSLRIKDGPRVPIEFKAVGLSDADLEFCKRYSGLLDPLLPPSGFLTLHTRLDHAIPEFTPAEIEGMHATAAAVKRPNRLINLAGVEVVAHDTELRYTRRLLSRVIDEAVKQFPSGMRGWAAAYWTTVRR